MNKTSDVIIIGGGVMGASTAFRLSERGLKVILVEKSFLAGGPTGRSSALVRQHYTHEVTARMALYSLRVFQNFDEIVGGESGFTKTGYLWLAPLEMQDTLEANVALQQGVGINTEAVYAEQLRELAPNMAEVDNVAAAYEPESGYADPSLTTNAFAAAARRHGAEIIQDSEVTDVLMANGRIQGVMTDRGQISAGIVINTAGPWAAHVASKVGVELPISSVRVQISMMAPPADEKPAPLTVIDLPNMIYFRPETGGHTLLGSLGPGEGEAADPDRYDESVDFDFILNTGERLIRRFPCMERGQSRGGYAGIYDVTPDRHAVLDEVPKGSGFFVAAGHSGHGFKLSPAVGVMMADLVTGQRTEELDPTLFRLARFAEGDTVQAKHPYRFAPAPEEE
jgi:glycine/D-amino acid oxidase-like deaminating enzyme